MSAPPTRPNVLVVLADDLGFSDLGCYGSEIPTPATDSVAAGGVRMSAFYSTPRCSPSRAALLTGRAPHEVGVGVLTVDDSPRGYRGTLDPDVPTLPQLLADAGYRSALSGKWHLASDVEHPNGSWPTERGFEHFFGILGGATSYWQPRTLARGTERVDAEGRAPGYHLTEAVTADAIAHVREGFGHPRPFFHLVAYTAPHWPLHASEEDVAAQERRYRKGWDDARARRLQRLVDLGVLPPGTRPASRDPEEPSWADTPDQEWQQRRMEVYAAQVAAMDRGIGAILTALEETGQAANTLVLVLSDNGACAEDLPVIPPGTPWDEDLCPSRTPDGRVVRAGNDPTIDPGPDDTYASYGRAWAGLSNAPLRRYKRWVHEGGISSPLIARWPDGGVGGEAAGSVRHPPAHLVDILPTVLDACGVELPSATTGRSLLREWRSGEPPEVPPVYYWEHVGNAAVRSGDLKLVRDAHTPWELYDMSVDRTELNDLAKDRPGDVTRLAGLWEGWARRVGVIPWEDVEALYVERGLPPAAAAG